MSAKVKASSASNPSAQSAKKNRRVRWTDGQFDFSLLNVLGDFAKSFEGNTIPTESDLETLLWALMQQDGNSGMANGEEAEAQSGGDLGAAGAHGDDVAQQRIKRSKPRKGYEWIDMQVDGQDILGVSSAGGFGDSKAAGGEQVPRSFYGRATKGYESRLKQSGQGDFGVKETVVRPLDLDRTKKFYADLKVAAQQDYQQISTILEDALLKYRQRTIDHLALAAIVQTLLKDYPDLLREFFAVTSPDDTVVLPRTEDPKARIELTMTPVWKMGKEDACKAPLNKKLPTEKGATLSGGGATQSAAVRAEQASRLLQGPSEDQAKHFLVRARLVMGDYYPWLLDNLVAMRMSLRANQYAALEKVSLLGPSSTARLMNFEFLTTSNPPHPPFSALLCFICPTSALTPSSRPCPTH